MDYVCMFAVLPTFLILSSMIGFETSVAMPPDFKFLKFLLFCFENYQIFVMEQKVLWRKLRLPFVIIICCYFRTRCRWGKLFYAFVDWRLCLGRIHLETVGAALVGVAWQSPNPAPAVANDKRLRVSFLWLCRGGGNGVGQWLPVDFPNLPELWDCIVNVFLNLELFYVVVKPICSWIILLFS